MNFSLDGFLLGVIVFLLFFLGSFVLYKEPRNNLNRSFFSLSLSILFWILATYFEDEVGDPTFRYTLLRADFSFGIFYAYMFLLFCADIVHLKVASNWLFRSFIYLMPTTVSALIFFTQSTLSGYEITPSGTINPVFGFLGTPYDILVALAVLIGIILVFWNYRRVTAEEKTRYIYLLIGMFLSIIIALITNVFLTSYIENSPEYEFYVRLGVFGSVFMALFPGYAIIKHRLFNIRVIATEILSFSILLTLLTQIFLSENLFQLVSRGVIFIVVFVLVAMLVHSVEAEVKRKEELQKLSNNLALANERLKELDTAKSEFISIASHQLRTPLTAIKGYLSLILEGSYGKVEPAVGDVLNKVYLVNSRLTQLVEDLLNISRIESGRIQYSFEPAQLEPIVAELVDMFALSAKEKNLTLQIKLPKAPLPKITLDANKIKESVSNLIDNALKYTKEGGVTVSVEKAGKMARITVADTGIGIQTKDMDKLFQKFTRSKETTKMVASGAGLGLYVGKNFISAHGGRIWAESAGANKGTRFIVELPLVNTAIHSGTTNKPSGLKAS